MEPAAEPQFRTIKIHPARAQFRLFPPGEAFYLGAPKRHVEPKPKKKKKNKALDNKWKKCVQSIVANNAIRDIASPFPRTAFEDDGGDYVTPKDPRVFSGLSTLSGRLKLNGDFFQLIALNLSTCGFSFNFFALYRRTNE